MVDDNNKNQLPEDVHASSNTTTKKAIQTDQNSQEVAQTSSDKQTDESSVPDGYMLPDAGSPDDFDKDMPIALLEFHSPTAAVINMPPTASAQYLTWLIGVLAFFSIIGICFFPLNKVVTAQGRLVSVDTPILIQSFEQGIIKSIDVKEGDYVAKGQVLAHLDPTITEADIENMGLQVQSGQAEYNRLRAEADGKDYTVDPLNAYSLEQGHTFLKRKLEYNARVDSYDQKIAEQQVQYTTGVASVAMLRSRVQLAQHIFEMRQKLEKQNVGSRLSTLNAQDTLMDAENRLITAQQNTNAVVKKIASLQADKTAYVEDWNAQVYKELVAVQRKLSSDESDYKKASLRNRKIVLRAPQDAVVFSISKGSVGSIMSPGSPFMTLIPAGTGLQVEGVVAAEEVGYVKIGDKALIKFSTLPFTQYGGAEGIVDNISADVFQPGDMTQETNRQGVAPLEFRQKPFYRVRLKINNYTLRNADNFFHLIPGLTVTADINVGKRTAAQYLMNGIVPSLTQGMRDPQ